MANSNIAMNKNRKSDEIEGLEVMDDSKITKSRPPVSDEVYNSGSQESEGLLRDSKNKSDSLGNNSSGNFEKFKESIPNMKTTKTQVHDQHFDISYEIKDYEKEDSVDTPEEDNGG